MSLRATYWVARRELHEMLRAPLVYGIGAVFLVVQGVAFAGLVNSLSDPRSAPPLGALLEGQLAGTLLTWVLQLVVLTLLGMRAIADDKKSGAWELLLTAQVGEGAAVIGKWLAASVLYALLWLPTLVYFGVVAVFRADTPGGWDWASIACGYVGAIAVGMALLAWAIAASAATRSTLAAGGLGFALLVVLFLVGEVPALWPELPVEHPSIARALEALGVRNAVLGFARGELGLPALVLVAGMTVTGLSLAIALACAGRRRSREVRTRLAATVGVGVVAILAGALATRHPARLDVSGESRNTLDPTTYEVMAALPAPASITIVQPTYGGLQPIYDEVERVAERMAESGPLTVRVVDPAAAPGGIVAIARTAGLARVDLEQSGSVVVELGDKRRVVDLLALATVDKGPGDAPVVESLAIEQALTGALATLTAIGGREIVACATVSHGEFPLRAPPATLPGQQRGDGADWSVVADRLRAEGIVIEDVAIDTAVPPRCRVLIIAGPAQALSPREALVVQQFLDQPSRPGLLVAAAGRTLPDHATTGLEAVLARDGIGLPAAIAVDPASSIREVPGAILVIDGYAEHPVNRGFARTRPTLWFQPRPVLAPAAKQLVTASKESWGERDLVTSPPTKDGDDLAGPVVLAAVGGEHRIVAVGSAESFTSSFITGTAVANDLWLARVVRWLANANDPKVDIAARIPTQTRLVLTDGERRTIVAISIAGVPVAWLALGGLILYVRARRAGRKSKRAS